MLFRRQRPGSCSQRLDTHGPLFQAPIFIHPPQKKNNAINYADILLRNGYADLDSLQGLVRGWCSLITLIKPDVLVADFAPTAVLAGHILDTPTVTLNTGFYLPPDNQDFYPSLQPWKEIPETELRTVSTQLLQTLGQLQNQYASIKKENPADLIQAQKTLMITFAELDHYGRRTEVDYLGGLFSQQGEPFPEWQQASGKKLFVYASAAHPLFKPLIQQLQKSDLNVLIHARDLNWQTSRRSIDGNLFISPQPLDMQLVLQEAVALVCHGGHGTLSAALANAVPMIVLPQQLEQKLLGWRLLQTGLLTHMLESGNEINFISIIEEVIQNQPLKTRLQKFKNSNLQSRPDSIINTICDRLTNG